MQDENEKLTEINENEIEVPASANPVDRAKDQAIAAQVDRRRTFAIISHPDAGKTTMTEKLLLYGGAIRLAGSVKARKATKHAVSDWMDIEKQRGISVTSSVLQFEYDGYCINILDTPGHQDFSEDTYRTLMAADSAVMLIDGAKGVEAQTLKLFHVCKMRGIPIFTFINKMDRAAKNPFDLMQEIEDVLGIKSYAMNWPIGTDGDFQGVYNRRERLVELYEGGNHGQEQARTITGEVDDPELRRQLGSYYHDRLVDEINLLDMAGDELDIDAVLAGAQTPIFFGSAMTNFGVKTFLEHFIKLAPCPHGKDAGGKHVDPVSTPFSGFIFKIQANMNPAHRDRLAFLRITSGRFEKGMEVWHTRTGRKIRLTQPTQFMAQERTIIDEAYAGDIIGLFDTGLLGIGDTLSVDDQNLRFEGMPVFPSEHFARVQYADAMKRKQFQKGIEQLSEEGAIQVFKQLDIGVETLIIGAVGVLQFEVLEHRLKGEYGVEIRMQQLPYHYARWLEDQSIDPHDLTLTSSTLRATDRDGSKVLLFENEWGIEWAIDKNKNLKLLDCKL